MLEPLAVEREDLAEALLPVLRGFALEERPHLVRPIGFDNDPITHGNSSFHQGKQAFCIDTLVAFYQRNC